MKPFGEVRKIQGFEDYGVCRDGHVWRVTGRPSAPYLLKTWPDQDGYMTVWLFKNGRRHRFTVHRLVLQAFYGSGGPSKVACHINGNKTDNRSCNLKWATQQENIDDKRIHGTVACGEKIGVSKLTASDVLSIRSRLAQYGNRKLPNGLREQMAKEFGVSGVAILKARKGETWAHV